MHRTLTAAFAAACLAFAPAAIAAPPVIQPPGGGGGASVTFPITPGQGGTGVTSTLTTGNAVSQNVTNPVTAGLIAELPLNDGTGTTARDITSSGNGATFASGGNAPFWVTGGWGLQFGGTDAQVNVATWATTPILSYLSASMYLCPSPGPQTTGTAAVNDPYPAIPVILAAPTNAAGVNVINAFGLTTGKVGAVVPSIYKTTNNGFVTASRIGLPGACGVLGVTYDTTDHIYWNGVEITSYSTGPGASASFVPLAGPAGYTLGAYPQNAWGWHGVMAYATFYSTVKSPAEMQAISNFETAQVTARPGFPKPTRLTTNAFSFPCNGDSLTATYAGTTQWCQQSFIGATGRTYSYFNWGIGGQLAQTSAALSSRREVTSCAPAAGLCTCTEELGTNDVATGYTAAEAYAAIINEANTMRAGGCNRIIGLTMISRTGLATQKNQLNTLLRANWKSFWDYQADVGAVPALGADSAYTNTACFNADGIHLTGGATSAGTCSNSLSGYGQMAAIVGHAINTLDGATADNPNSTTATSYSETYADGYLTANPSANAGIALPDCTGMTGDTRTINNISAFTETVTGAGASSTFLGASTIAATTTATFKCVLVSGGASTGGNQWLRVQ